MGRCRRSGPSTCACARASCGGCTQGSRCWPSWWCPCSWCSAWRRSKADAGRRACTRRTWAPPGVTTDAHPLSALPRRRVQPHGGQRFPRPRVLREPAPRRPAAQCAPDPRRLPHLPAQQRLSRRQVMITNQLLHQLLVAAVFSILGLVILGLVWLVLVKLLPFSLRK